MTISELSPRSRQRVAWFHDDAPLEGVRAFEERGFAVDNIGTVELSSATALAGVAAVIFTQNSDKLAQTGHHLAQYARLLLDCDCRIVIRPAPSEQALGVLLRGIGQLDFDVASPLEKSLPQQPHIRIFDVAVPWTDIANYVMENPPGPAPRAQSELAVSVLDADGRPAELSVGHDILVRRAFADCAEVHLLPMDEIGKSGAVVYRAYAELRFPAHGRRPVPYFVKLGSKDKILREHTNYLNHVLPYIPFHLGPHLVRERCCLGASEGILVGDYVDESESLVSCAPGGRSAAAISCLFDRTLHGWYRNPEVCETTIAQVMRVPSRIAPSRIAQARKLGATKDLEELNRLFGHCTAKPVLFGGAHGDLHASNIRVRASDAIVIDFFAYKQLPLVYDPASLEASLLVDGFRPDKRTTTQVLSSVADLYAAPPLEMGHIYADPQNPSAWFYKAVARIRLHARQMERGPNQYAGALAVALLRKAKKDPSVGEPAASLHAMAYVIAEWVLTASFGQGQPIPSS